MQSPPKGSMYPTLDPEVNQPLEIYLYRGSKFGYVDSGSLAGLAKSKLTELYAKNYPDCIHKLPLNLLKQVNTDLITSYVDDLSLGTTLHDIELELAKPTFSHNHNYQQLSLYKQGELVTIAKALRVLHVLDFSGFTTKKFHASTPFVEDRINQVCEEDTVQAANTDICPDQASLKQEILSRGKFSNNSYTKPISSRVSGRSKV